MIVPQRTPEGDFLAVPGASMYWPLYLCSVCHWQWCADTSNAVCLVCKIPGTLSRIPSLLDGSNT